MKRRQFVKASLASGAAILGIGTGTFLLIEEISQDNLTIDFALKKLDELSNENLLSLGEWDPYQIFTHCAQSVEFSITLFPEHKSSIFKGTVGKLAFSIIALNRLKKSLIEFNNYQGALAPHFAYGQLTKDEYEKAHLMHLYNHLQQIKS